jgi:hypothetical protein
MVICCVGEGMDEMEFTEAESNMNDLVSEYQQYQVLNTNILESVCEVFLTWYRKRSDFLTNALSIYW